MPSLLAQLAEHTDVRPHDRKLLIGPSIAWGRELLGALAHARGGWIGWTALTLDQLAAELTYTSQAQRRVRRVGSLEQQMLLDAALDAAESSQPLPDDVRQALRRTGARRAICDAVIELRHAGAGRAARDGWAIGALLDRTRDEYEARLRARALVDEVDILALAIAADADTWQWFADTQLVLGDLAPLTGLRATLRDQLVARGATVLTDDATLPTRLAAFAAATPTDELREVLRRALAQGLDFDDVEIAATDDDAYAIALDGVCTALGIEASMTRGVPFAATRVGRVVMEWLDAIPLPDAPLSPRNVAGELLLRLDAMDAPAGSSDDRNRVRCADELRSVMTALDQAMPADAAVGLVREAILALRGWTPVSGVERPRFAGAVRRDGTIVGRVHLTTLANAGLTGRRLCAIVGLDAERTRGPMIQSAVLPDAWRARISDALPTTAQRRRARAALVTQAIVRGAATSESLLLSFSTASATTGRDAGPSQALLDAVRHTDSAVRDHDLLRSRLGAPIGASPRVDGIALDARDVWLRALTRDALLLDGSALVAATLTGLRAGVARAAAEQDPLALDWHGLVPAARTVEDPRATVTPISPSSLETLGSCALRWFYERVLEIAPLPPPPDPDVWLDAKTRGELLHRVYALITRRKLLAQRTRAREEVEHDAIVIADRVLADHRADSPPPSDHAFADEREAFAEEVRHFVRYEWAEAPSVTVATEESFGRRGTPVGFALPDGSSVRLAGTIDRADQLEDGTLRIIDYKTGGVPPSGNGEAPLAGGRRLQLPLYAAAAEVLLGRAVSRAELRHPTVRGGGDVVAMDENERAAAPAVVQSLLDGVAAGAFLPTDDPADCRWCSCAAICRVRVDRFGQVDSPRAEWASAASEGAEAHAALRAQRARRSSAS